MCSIKYLHKEFKLRYNAVDSNHKKDFPPAFIDDFYNSALFSYVEMFSTGNNAKRYKLGFEVTQQRVDMLSTLVVESKLENPLYNDVLKRYEFPLGDLPHKYFHLVRAYAITDCGIINIVPEQKDDLNVILNDPYKKPSKTWKRLVSSMSRSTASEDTSLYIYTNGEINLDGIYIEYIKCPRKVFFGGYNTIDCGTPGEYCAADLPVSTDIPDKYCDVLVDLAVQEAARTLYDVNQLNLRETKIVSQT